MIQEFIEHLESLYYEGFAEQFCREYPQEFTEQLNEFLNNTVKPAQI